MMDFNILETLEKRLSSKISQYNTILNDDTSGELPLEFDKEMIEKGKETAKKSLNKLVKRLEQVESGEFLPD